VTLLEPPPALPDLPVFDDGWLIDGQPAPYLSYADSGAANWSEELEDLHEEASRTHFIDVWTRQAILARVGDLPPAAVVVDLGCSTGYLLEELRRAQPKATLIGVDLVAGGLRKAHASTPSARLLQADVCDLPLADDSVDAIVSANLLEHVPDDRGALKEIRRVLRPGAPAVIVVPAGPGAYDYYDRFLGHERRYARHELSRKASAAGLEIVEDTYIASLLYPPFWLVKQRNRRRYAHLEGEALEQRVARDIASTSDSRIGRLLRRVEERVGLRLPFGIRNLIVARGTANR
jgi:ubiquinone/menaquinone biosynthesis C-methylase UbiE